MHLCLEDFLNEKDILQIKKEQHINLKKNKQPEIKIETSEIVIEKTKDYKPTLTELSEIICR